jgi:hypothetical protein
MTTPIEFIESRFRDLKKGGDMYQFCIFIDELKNVINEAKTIEKYEIINSFNAGVKCEAGINTYIGGEDYYNKIFKKN